MAYSKTAPQQLAAAVRRVAEAQTEWAMGFIEAGVDGLFYSGQFSEPGRFTDEEFALLVKEGDLTILRAAETKIVILSTHEELPIPVPCQIIKL